MKNIKFLLILFVFCTVAEMSPAQGILNRVIKQSSRKIEREVGNMVVNKVSDAIARKATQSLESAFDKMIREALESDSNYVNNSDVPDSIYYKTGQRYGAFLAGLNNAVNLPEKYVFDIHILSETTDHDGSTHEMKMHFSKEKPLIAIEQMEKSAGSFMILDLENDITAIYQNKNGKQTVQALPSMMGLAAGMSEPDNDDKFDFKPNGKTKTIAGYKAKGFAAQTKTERILVYISKDVPIDWRDSFGQMIQKISPTAYINGSEEMAGMILESSTMEKKKPYKDSMYKAKKVVEETITIDNSKYEKTNYGN